MRRYNIKVLAIAGCCAVGSFTAPSAEAVPELSYKDYSFGYWLNGMRKHEDDTSSDKLCIETGYYGLALDVNNLGKARFGELNDTLDYSGALSVDQSRMIKLKEAALKVHIEKDGKVYRAVTAKVGTRDKPKRLGGIRMWESARYVQHYDLQGLVFKSSDGETLLTDGKLDVVAWPNSLSFTAELAPGLEYKDGPEFGVHGKGRSIIAEPVIVKHHPKLENEVFTLEAWIKIPEQYFEDNNAWIICKNKNESNDGNYGFLLRKGQLSAALNIGGRRTENRYFARSGNHDLNPDQWHHIAMSYDAKTLNLFIDGRKEASQVVGKKRVLGTGDLSLGKRADGRGETVNVVLDQVRIWNRVLDDKELRNHFRKPTELRNRAGLTYENEFETSKKVERIDWANVRLGIRFEGEKRQWKINQTMDGEWRVGEKKKLTLNCDLAPVAEVKVSAEMKLNTLPPVSFDKEYNCYVAKVRHPKRSWDAGYTDIRDYDEIDITIESNKAERVPFLLDMVGPANVTGVCPILCDENGVPTGIPVQVSKNWHYPVTGSYVRAYAVLPTAQGQTKYKLRLVYGFYGTVPSASHGQLSLIGYGGNGRWDQLAIGCWGETYCMDMDMSLVDVAVTDIRMLMARAGKDAKKWTWTDAGWGGDWLGLGDSKGQKHLFKELKTAYLAHGPCLSDVQYDGYYGAKQEVDLAARVRTLRTDDYARTFTTLKYGFKKTVKAEGWLFKMGRTHNYVTPKIAYGNGAGLLAQKDVPGGLKQGSAFVSKTQLTGAGPWWVSFPGAYHSGGKKQGSGYRAMVIRSYRVVAGGKTYNQPAISFPAFKSAGNGLPNLDLLIEAPAGVSEFIAGDSVELDVEWITLPREADDYYGPNESFRKHLVANPSSWKTTHLAAKGNDLRVEVGGGKLIHSYPIIVKSEANATQVKITGGVGYVPIRFEGLKSAYGNTLYQVVVGKEVKLDQAVHGNDFWQTDYDAKSGTYKITYNLPLDGKVKSHWVLRSKTQ